ncbi:MAG: hypothetical protein WCO54_09690 [Bacteroidota bacterium]
MIKKLLILFVLFSISHESYCQLSASKHHFFNKSHKNRVVVNKKYNLISDSSFLSYELMTGNFNAWNGDVYNQYPSVQFLSSYDNNINFETGIYVCVPYTVVNGLNPAGVDAFISYKIHTNLYAIFDIYHFIGYHSDLITEMGYNSSVYNMSTLRLQYDYSQKTCFFVGYSVLNDLDNLQQSLFVEADFAITKNIPILVGYASDTNIGDLNFNNVYTGIGYRCTLLDKKGFDLKFLSSINPLYFEQASNNWPVSLLISTEF